MSFKVYLHPKADNSLKKLDSKLEDRVRSKIKGLSEKPQKKGQRLKPSDFHKLRMGDYRVIYEIWHDEKKVVVLFIGHRSKVYDDFTRLV